MNFSKLKLNKNIVIKIFYIFIIIFFLSVSVFAENLERCFLNFSVLAPKSIIEQDFKIEKWKSDINDYLYGNQSKDNYIEKFRDLDLWSFINNLLGLDDKRQDKVRSSRQGERKDRRHDLTFPLNNINLNALENKVIEYIHEELFKIYRNVSTGSKFQKLSNLEKISKINEDARIFINLWLQKRNDLPKRLYDEIASIEKMQFQTSITEAITHELKSLKNDTKSISMMGFGIAMSELNKSDYNLADFVRNIQVEFFSDLFRPECQVMLAFNKVVIFGMNEKWNIKRNELNGMTILEYLNLYGINGLKDAGIKENQLNELLNNKMYLLDKYEKSLLDRINFQIDNKISSEKMRERWKKNISELSLYKNSNPVINFNVFTRKFSNLQSKLINIIENKTIGNKLGALNEALNEEILLDEEKIKKEIDPILIKVFGMNQLQELSESLIDSIDEEIYLRFMNDELFKDLESFSEFKKYLKNLIKRKRYIKFDVYGNLINFLNIFKNTFYGKAAINEQVLKDIVNEMSYLKALEIQARVFNEFEGRSKGLKYYYEEMDGMGDIPTEMFWYSEDLGDGNFLPDRDRVELLRLVTNNDFLIFSNKMKEYRNKAMRNARHHRLIEKEFFDVICEQSINFYNKNEGNQFFNLGYLWNTKYPLIATIDGDELRVVFLGPNNKSYTVCFDFNNFQACDLSLRKMNGAPYSRDNLLFDIHESVINSLIKGINAFIESGANNEEFEIKYLSDIYKKSMTEALDNVFVDLNPNKLPGEEIHLQKEYFENILSLLNEGKLTWNNGIIINEKDEHFSLIQKEMQFNISKIKMFLNNNISVNELRSLSSKRELDDKISNFFYIDENGKIISPILNLPLRYYFFEGLSKTEFSGRKTKGVKNNVEIGGITMSGLSLPDKEDSFIPHYVFGQMRSKLDDALSKVKKMIKFSSLLYNNDGSLNIDGEIYSKDRVNAQLKLIAIRKEFFGRNSANSFLLKGISDNIKNIVGDFLYRMDPGSWEVFFKEGFNVSVYDKEFLSEEAVREHLNSLFVAASPEIVNLLISFGRHLNKEFIEYINKDTDNFLIAA